MLELNARVGIYIPSTEAFDLPIPAADYRKRSYKVGNILARLFGGSTIDYIPNTEGLWLSSNGQVIEDITLVYAYASTEALCQHYDRILQLGARLCRLWSQDCIGIEFVTKNNVLPLFVLVDKND